jgi:hypothetical protein
VSPRVKPKPRERLPEWRPKVEHPPLAEFRSEAARGEFPRAFSDDAAFWKYLLTPATPSPLGGAVYVYGLDREEHRVLSKASSAAGGYLVPTSFDEQITAARRARAVVAAISRELVTGEGTQLLIPSTTTHGVATWTAENAAYTASDVVFGQVSVGAFKGGTAVACPKSWHGTPPPTSRVVSPTSSGSGSPCSRRPRSRSVTGQGSRSGSRRAATVSRRSRPRRARRPGSSFSM